MSGDTEYGKCDMCGNETFLSRTYFHYNIPCECCGCKRDGKDMHFELVKHCKDCIPDVPKEIKPVLKSKIDNKEYRLKIEGMLPYSIDGQFIINHDMAENHVF